jgi:hypothetical protein
MALLARIASAINLQHCAAQLKKTTENRITRLDIKTWQRLLYTISKPTDDFKKESDYTNVIKAITKGVVTNEKTEQRSCGKKFTFGI